MIYHTSPIAAIYPCYPTPTIILHQHTQQENISGYILLHLHLYWAREHTQEELSSDPIMLLGMPLTTLTSIAIGLCLPLLPEVDIEV